MSQNVLWLDDDEDTIRGAVSTLKLAGHTVTAVRDVGAASKALADSHFDLVVLDQQLSAEDGADRGEDLLAALREGRLGTTNASAPFVFVTANRDWIEGDFDAVDGFEGVLEKAGPFSTRLLEVLRTRVAVPSLIGVDGRPLSRGSAEYGQLAAKLRTVSDEAFRELGRKPEWMLDLHWRDWEDLIAEVFVRNGFDVERTATSGDRGVDLYAVKHSGFGRLLFVVECKRYRPDRPIGPNIVRELRGVVDRENANCGVLATTSYFGPGALREEAEMPFRLSLNELKRVAAWIQGEPLL